MLKWYPNLTANHSNGLLKYTSSTITKNSIIVCHQGIEFRKFAMFNYLHNFSKHFLKESIENRCYYEVILGSSFQKPYFDIDIDTTKDENIDVEKSITLIDEIKKCILGDSRIKETDILVFSSHGENKLSYHIVVNNWCLLDHKSNKIYCNRIIDNVVSPYKKYIDALVYKSIQQFRTYGSTKRGKDRKKILVGENISVKDPKYRFKFISTLFSSLISNTCSCKVIEYNEQVKKVFDDSALEDLNEIEIDCVKNLPFIVSGIFEMFEPKGRLIPLKRLLPSYCEICKRDHQNENPYLTIINNSVYFHCRRTSDDKLFICDIKQKEEPVSIIKEDETKKDKIDVKTFLKTFLSK